MHLLLLLWRWWLLQLWLRL